MSRMRSRTTSARDSFGPSGTAVSLPSAPKITAALWATSKPRPFPTSLTTSRSQPLRASLDRPWVSTPPLSSPVSAAKPTTTWPGRTRSAPSSVRMSGLRTRASDGGSAASVFLILTTDRTAGAKSATAAAITIASAPGAAASTAVRSSAVETTGTTVTPAGNGTARLAATSVTSAPRAAAVLASATPWRPDERLPRKRTGSRCSRVPPALTTTWRPARSARSPATPRASTNRATAKISVGSGSRPAPESAPVRRPTAGSSTTALRQRGDVDPGGRVFPHLGMHRRRVHHRARHREQRRGQQVVGPTGGGARQQVSGGGGHQREFGLPAEAHVRHGVGVRPDVGSHQVAGQRGPGRLADEPQRAGGGDDPNGMTGLGQQSEQLDRLVRRDTSGHAEDDAATDSHGRGSGRNDGGNRLDLDLLMGQQASVDLAQGDRERLLLHSGFDQRPDVLQQPFAELRVVGVDLAGALGRVDHQAILGVSRLE